MATPALPDLTDIIDRIWFWITKSDSDIVPHKMSAAYLQKGGWEGWAQVEIAYLVEQHYNNVQIDREVNVYSGTGQENDFVITDKTDPKKAKQIVELKCERNTQTASQFRASFVTDINKINSTTISSSYIPAKAYAVAISVTTASYNELSSWAQGRPIRWIQCGQTGIWIWWYEKDIRQGTLAGTSHL